MSDIIKRLNSESERYIPYLKIPVPEEVILDKEDYAEASLLLLDLGTYVEMSEYNFVVGEKNWDVNNDANWNSYLTALKGYRYEEVVAMYNNALNG